ncbi:MAG: hypothetical protein R6U98_07650 [Pirellulaceae bacterium]
MKTYRFTVYFRGIDYMSEEMAEALYEAGCDDCSPGSHGGQAYADFARQADSLEAAVASAAAHVRTAGYSIDHVQIDDADLAVLSAVGHAANG